MDTLPVSEDQLKEAISEILEESNLGEITASILRAELEKKFNLENGELTKHRDLISKLMSESIDKNMEQTDLNELDSYLQENIDEDDDDDDNNNNNNKNKKRNRKKSKNRNKNSNNEVGIMDINYTDPSHSRSYDILIDHNNVKYSIMLNQTDISYGQRGHNKFYAIQILEHQRRGAYKFICKWGRVGNKAQTSEVVVDSKVTAIELFRKKFESKTKNEFGTRHFKPVKNKYIPIAVQSDDDADHNSDDEKQNDDDDGDGDGEPEQIPESKLDVSLIRVLKLIFSKQLQMDTAKALDVDINRCPLGALSQSQINRGYHILCDINDILVNQRGTRNDAKLSTLTSKFYTIIPHDFGMRRPPIINHTKLLHKKIELIETLREMIFTNKILKKRAKRKNPIDVHYSALHCDITPLPEFDMKRENIINSIKGTHASTHNRYELEIIDCFQVNRHGSKFRHLPFKNAFHDSPNGNCKLLWHGSRLSNFVGILSQGLRIAPPEAPATGYMFGKGLYFADCASKSANYIHATEQHPYGLLILSQCALGNMYPLTKAEYLVKPPDGYHSVKAIGKTIPKYDENDDKQQFTANIEGYKLSVGPLVENENENVINDGQLLYNEYIVYDVAQVRMEYIALIKFIFK